MTQPITENKSSDQEAPGPEACSKKPRPPHADFGSGGAPHLSNCPKCRTPIARHIEVCTSCGARVADFPSPDRPRRE